VVALLVKAAELHVRADFGWPAAAPGTRASPGT